MGEKENEETQGKDFKDENGNEEAKEKDLKEENGSEDIKNKETMNLIKVMVKEGAQVKMRQKITNKLKRTQMIMGMMRAMKV